MGAGTRTYNACKLQTQDVYIRHLMLGSGSLCGLVLYLQARITLTAKTEFLTRVLEVIYSIIDPL
jgi:hypothetical protein